MREQTAGQPVVGRFVNGGNGYGRSNCQSHHFGWSGYGLSHYRKRVGGAGPQIHKTLPVATAALGRSLMAASMMGNQLKGEENSLTLQIKGGGPLGMTPASAMPRAMSGLM